MAQIEDWRQGIATEPEKVTAHACLTFLHSFFPELELPEGLSQKIIQIRSDTMRAIIDLAGGQGAEYDANLSAVITDEDGNVYRVRVDEVRITMEMITLHLSAIEAICNVINSMTGGRKESEIRLAAAGGYKKVAELMESHVDELLEIASKTDNEEFKSILLGECEKARTVVSCLAFGVLGGGDGIKPGFANPFRFLFKPVPPEETFEVAQMISYIESEAGRVLTTDAIKLHNSRVKIAKLIGIATILISLTPVGVLAKPLIDMLADELEIWARITLGLLHPTAILGCLVLLNRVFGGILGKLKAKDLSDPEVMILKFRGLIRKYKLLFDGDKRLNAGLTKKYGVDFYKQAEDIAALEDMIREIDFSRSGVGELMAFFQEVMNVKDSMRAVATGTSREIRASETAEDADDTETTSKAPQVLS